MKITDAVSVAGMRLTDEGYLEAAARTARTGVQQYFGAEVGKPEMDVVSVYRDEADVFAKASLETFSKLPITMDHPSSPVTADTWKQHAVGTTGDDVLRDGEYLKIGLKITDAAAVKAVQDGTRELSVGYTAEIQWGDGIAPDGTPYEARQTGIVANHIAIVDQARAGSRARIGDRAENWGAAPFTTTAQEASMADNPKLRTVIVDGLSVETTDAGAQAIEKLNKQLADASAEHDKAIATKDADLAKKDARITELETQVVDGAALDKLVKDRAALIEDADKVAGKEVQTSGLSDAEIRKTAVTARLGDKALEGKSDAYVEAMFDALRDGAVSAPKSDAFADAARGGVKTHTEDGWGDKVFARAGVKMKKEG